MDGDLCAGDVFEDALVGGGFAARVVLGLEAVDGDDDIQFFELFANAAGMTRKALVTIWVWTPRLSIWGRRSSSSR